MIGTAVGLHPPTGRVRCDLPRPRGSLRCCALLVMVHSIETFTNCCGDGAGDALSGRGGELARQPLGLPILDVEPPG